jgi:DNA-binding response OmpR family regulator
MTFGFARVIFFRRCDARIHGRMKILINDHEAAATELLASRIRQTGHTVVMESNRQDALARLENEEFGAVIIDPAPQTQLRQVVTPLRRSGRGYLYIMLTGAGASIKDALAAGANDIFAKPYDMGEIETRLQNMDRLQRLIRHIGDEREDFPSAGGVIAKSAFNQLFLSCIDRAGRYAERSYVLFMQVANHKRILADHGDQAARFTAAKLASHLVNLRRQSDIIAQTGQAEFALLLQRPIFETEPIEAANRFALSLKKLTDYGAHPGAEVVLRLDLVELPSGALPVSHEFECITESSTRPVPEVQN